jgi:hypothetical protein
VLSRATELNYSHTDYYFIPIPSSLIRLRYSGTAITSALSVLASPSDLAAAKAELSNVVAIDGLNNITKRTLQGHYVAVARQGR